MPDEQIEITCADEEQARTEARRRQSLEPEDGRNTHQDDDHGHDAVVEPKPDGAATPLPPERKSPALAGR